jgi:hypothetical protein
MSARPGFSIIKRYSSKDAPKNEDPRFQPLLIAACELLNVYRRVPEDGL